ncbi:MAG TPA: MFS transporter [Terriglobia bacterium]|nr:MFS transporter [Terriglobia bacterium]
MSESLSRTVAPATIDSASHTRHLIAVRLLPFLFILYIANYFDRTSTAYAALGLSRDLGFSDRVIGLGSGIFFVSYVALQVPGALLVEKWSARRMISITMIAWGSLTALTGLVHSPNQLYIARILLGAAEAGFFPGVIVYLSHWFIQEDRAKATSNFMGAIPLSFVVASPIAGWILSHSWRGLPGWRWLFFLEGTPAILLGVAAFFYLTDFPHQAAWLPPERRQWIELTLQGERSDKTQPASVWAALRSRTVVIFAVATFFNYFTLYSFAFWFPTLLKRETGLSDMRIGLLGAIPYAVAFLVMQGVGWHSDKTLERRWHAAVPMFIAAFGLLGVISPLNSVPLAIFWFALTASAYAYLPTFWAMPTEILSLTAAAAAVGLINSVGSVAGFAGPYAFGYLQTRTGSPFLGLCLMAAAAVIGGMLLLRSQGRPRADGSPRTIR